MEKGPSTLRGRRLEIAAGRTDLPRSTVILYRQRWAAQGHDLPPLEDGGDPGLELAPRR